ncbi:MAG: hypothetical protein E7543_02310 [Ruminococcaceae bacterium]|nr:hypothetical protein [Oscillospiraceae bacterium]MBQ9912623.1 hypothetical protein [Clostridia bacterium]
MDNETKLSSEQINSIKEALSDENEPRALEQVMEKHLNEKQRQAVKSFLSDEKKLKALLNSPFAKAFMEKYGGKTKE